MRKILTILSLAIASLVLITAFVTASNYLQLTVAIVLYPLFIYFAFRVLPRKAWHTHPIVPAAPIAQIPVIQPEKDSGGVADIDKRTFLTVVGATGLSFFLYSISKKMGGIPIFGNSSESTILPSQSSDNNKSDSIEKDPTEGFVLTEVDDSIVAYLGYLHKDGSWYIIKVDTESGSYRYVRGASDFPASWTKRDHFKYDYYANVF